MRLNLVVWMRKSPYTGICIVSTVVAGPGLTFLQPVTADWSTANTHLVTSGKLHPVMPDVIHAMPPKPTAGIGPACSLHVLHMREGVAYSGPAEGQLHP